MKRYKSREFNNDCRICGAYNGALLAIARAITSNALGSESMHAHDNGYEFYIFLDGEAELQIGNDVIKTEKGDVILIEPGEMHKLKKVVKKLDYITIKTNLDINDKKIL